jgi:hypothetical protein
MRIVLLPLAVTAFLMTGQAAFSQSEGAPITGAFEDGNVLLQQCGSHESFTDGVCAGYVTAVADAMGNARTSGETVNGLRACIPYGVTRQQVHDVGLRFLRAHPELRHRAAFGFMVQAIAEAFPCRD